MPKYVELRSGAKLKPKLPEKKKKGGRKPRASVVNPTRLMKRNNAAAEDDGIVEVRSRPACLRGAGRRH